MKKDSKDVILSEWNKSKITLVDFKKLKKWMKKESKKPFYRLLIP